LIFDKDVCFDEKTFVDIYRPICVLRDLKGNRISIISFKIFEKKKCREYSMEYILKDNYSGLFSFEANESNINLLTKKNNKQIFDTNSNIVDFTKLSAHIYFDNSELIRAKELRDLKEMIDGYQAMLAYPILIAQMAFGP